MRLEFFDRLRLLLAATSRGGETGVTEWRAYARKHYIADGMAKDTARKATLAWTHRDPVKRRLPKGSPQRRLIDEATRALLGQVNLPEEVLTNWQLMPDAEFIAALQLDRADVAKIVPELALDQGDTRRLVRERYEMLRVKNNNIVDCERNLSGRNFYCYRMKAVSGEYYRDALKFSFDRGGRLVCDMNMFGGRSFSGTAYVSATMIYALLMRENSREIFENQFLCMCMDDRKPEWPGLILGHTDGGHSPCAVRALIVAGAIHEPPSKGAAIVDERLWSKAQAAAMRKYLNPRSSVFAEDFGLVVDRNFLEKFFNDSRRFVVERD